MNTRTNCLGADVCDDGGHCTRHWPDPHKAVPMHCYRSVLCAIALLTTVLLTGCSSVTGPSGQLHDQYARSAGRVDLSMLTAPAWTPGERVPARVLSKQLEAAFGVRPRLDDVWYVPIPRDVMQWAWSQTTAIRTEGAEQIRAYLARTYGEEIATRYYEKYRPEAQDCEDFARQTMTICKWIIGIRYGIEDATPAIGVIHVTQLHDWGGVAGSGDDPFAAHALNWAMLDSGAHIIEPQSGAIAPAKDYPNKPYLLMGRHTTQETGDATKI